MTFQTLNRDTDPSVTASYYACPFSGTKNITISLNFKNSDFLNLTNISASLPTALTTLNLKALESSSIAGLKPLETSSINCLWNTPPIKASLSVAELKSLCAQPSTTSNQVNNKQWLNKETYGHSTSENYLDPNFFKDWWNKDNNLKPVTDSDRLDFALKSLEKSFDKDKKKEIIKEIQKLLEKLLD